MMTEPFNATSPFNVSRTDITDRVYTHKTLSQLIEAVNRL